MLHVTNGDSVVQAMRLTNLPGEYLSWIDALHDGPVPHQTPGELAMTRAQFIASLGWGLYDGTLHQLHERDAKLAWHDDDDEIVLWFEHDLFDQLQLIQILDRIARADFAARLSLICIDRFSGVQEFVGLGQLTPEQLFTLFPARREISAKQLNLGEEAWKAFCSPGPNHAWRLLEKDTSALPFLRPAFLRLFEEFPSTRNGLSRTEEQLLRAVLRGARDRRNIYLNSCKSEQAIFMGDASVFWRLDRLAGGPKAALRRTGDSFELTDFGRAILDGQADWIRDRGGVDLWLGGTHLKGADAKWRWDPERRSLLSSGEVES